MELISSADLYQALSVVLMPAVLLWITGGVVLGMIVGATPGLTATAGVAIATPLTFSMDFQSAMALLLGIYCGGYFAGSIPAILINTPGAPGNAATAMAGYPLARRGQANLALGLAVISSVIGGWLSALCLLLAAPGLASIALKFTSAEYFALGLFGLTCVAAIAGGSLLKGITAALLGMVLGCVGIDPVSGTERLTFALPDLLGGVPLVPALIAFFAITELISKGVQNSADDIVATQDQVRLSALLPYYIRHKWLVLKSAAIGTGIGMLPGTGPTIAAWIAYGEALRSEKKAAKHESDNPRSERAESGSVPGVIAAETANNAVTGGALIPMLTLGIPGDTVTAVLIGALLIQGIEPGPFFIRTETALFTQLLLVLLIANALVLIFGLAARRALPLILTIPTRILVPVVAVLCASGVFAINNSSFDVVLIAALGLTGYLLLRFGYPMAPLVLGLVLGPIVETNFRNALAVSEMNPGVFFSRPISAGLIITTVLVLLWSWRRQVQASRG